MTEASSPGVRRRGHLATEVALTTGAVLGVLCALWALASLALGLTPLVLVSGSMSPAIGTGDLAVARAIPAAEVAVGDVVSVRGDAGVRVTHRVVETRPVAQSDGARALVLRGDANAAPDPTPYVVTSVDRVVLHVPHVGRVVAAVSGRGGLLVVCVVVAGLLLLGFGTAPPASGPGGPGGPGRPAAARHRDRRARGRGRRAGAAVATGALVVAAGWAVPPPAPTTAYLTDAAAVAVGPLGAGAMAAPVITCSGGGVLGRPTISWPVPQSPAPLQYEVRYGATTRTVTGTSWQVPAELLTIGTFAITVRSQRAGWSSVASNTVQVQVVAIVGSSCA